MSGEVLAPGDGKAYSYDLNGNLLSAADADGYVTEYSYNALNLITGINYNGGKQVSYAYNKAGYLTEMTDWNGTSLYENDPLGRLTRLTDVKGRITEYAYDPAGNKTGITYPDGSKVSYEYDTVGRLAKVTDSDGSETLYAHDILGRLTETLYPNGETQLNEYNSLGQLIKTSEGLTVTNPEDPNDILIEELRRVYEYTYGETGNLIEEIITGTGFAEPLVKSYVYDSADRLTRAEDAEGVREYTYDPAGNMTGEINAGAVTSYVYNELNQLVSKVSGEYEHRFSYDRRGNQILETRNGNLTVQYEYDETNRMTKGVNADAEESLYTYDGFGSRTEHVTFTAGGLKRTEYVIDITSLQNRELVAYQNNGEVTRSVYGYGKISEVIYPAETPTEESITKRYFHQDRLGSTAYVSDESGAVLAYTDRDEWGKVRSVTRTEAGMSIINPEAMSSFTGHSYDTVLDKYFAQARMYDAVNKRFLAEDVIKDGFNWYSYCHNNPVMYVDLTGRAAVGTMAYGIEVALASTNSQAAKDAIINAYAKMFQSSYQTQTNSQTQNQNPGSSVSITGSQALASNIISKLSPVSQAYAMLAGSLYLQGIKINNYVTDTFNAFNPDAACKKLQSQAQQIKAEYHSATTKMLASMGIISETTIIGFDPNAAILKGAGIVDYVSKNNVDSRGSSTYTTEDEKKWGVNVKKEYADYIASANFSGNTPISFDSFVSITSQYWQADYLNRLKSGIATTANDALYAAMAVFSVFTAVNALASSVNINIKWSPVNLSGISINSAGEAVLRASTYAFPSISGVSVNLGQLTAAQLNQLASIAYSSGSNLSGGTATGPNSNSSSGTSEGAGNLKPQALMDDLAKSGVKYNPNDVVMVTKTPDGKLLWLENGSNSAGLKHIVNGHATNFADKGITDIPSFLNQTLQNTPINTGMGAGGPFADYLINGSTYRVAYGTNGFIVSFYPIN